MNNCVKSGNLEQFTILSYGRIKDELCTYGDLLLRDTRMVVPKVLLDKVIRLAHEGHQGVVKTKSGFRSKVWWVARNGQRCKVGARFAMAVTLLQVATHLIRCVLFCLQVFFSRTAV